MARPLAPVANPIRPSLVFMTRDKTLDNPKFYSGLDNFSCARRHSTLWQPRLPAPFSTPPSVDIANVLHLRFSPPPHSAKRSTIATETPLSACRITKDSVTAAASRGLSTRLNLRGEESLFRGKTILTLCK